MRPIRSIVVSTIKYSAMAAVLIPLTPLAGVWVANTRGSGAGAALGQVAAGIFAVAATVVMVFTVPAMIANPLFGFGAYLALCLGIGVYFAVEE